MTMKLFFICITFWCISSGRSEEKSSTTTAKPLITDEDLRVINETITKYGPMQDYKELGLPGPEILGFLKKGLLENRFDVDESGKNYTLKTRRITPAFSYNRRYEENIVEIIDDEEISMVKGQFGEHFERKSGGSYVRTIGYTLDENGYREFLIDLSLAMIKAKKRISSTVIASLTGGGLG